MWQAVMYLWRQVSSDYMNEVFIKINIYFFTPFLLVLLAAHLTDASAELNASHPLPSDLQLLSFESQCSIDSYITCTRVD